MSARALLYHMSNSSDNTCIKIFVLVTLAIFGIGHYQGYLCFTNTCCLVQILNAPHSKLFDELLLIDAASNFTPSHSLMDFLRICFCTFSLGQKLIYSNSLNLCSGKLDRTFHFGSECRKHYDRCKC